MAGDIIFIVIISLAVSPAAIAVFLYAKDFKERMQQGNCSVYVRGVIVDVKRRWRRRRSDVFNPVYEYEYMGKRYRVTSMVDLGAIGNEKKIGTEVELYVDPSNPLLSFCPKDAKEYQFQYKICIVAIILLIIAPFALYLFYYRA